MKLKKFPVVSKTLQQLHDFACRIDGRPVPGHGKAEIYFIMPGSPKFARTGVTFEGRRCE